MNKHVITFSGFNFPITLALWHMVLGTVTSRVAVRVLRIPDTIKEHASPQLYFQVGMIGVLFGATLVTGNAALWLLTVPTVQMLKVGSRLWGGRGVGACFCVFFSSCLCVEHTIHAHLRVHQACSS